MKIFGVGSEELLVGGLRSQTRECRWRICFPADWWRKLRRLDALYVPVHTSTTPSLSPLRPSTANVTTSASTSVPMDTTISGPPETAIGLLRSLNDCFTESDGCEKWKHNREVVSVCLSVNMLHFWNYQIIYDICSLHQNLSGMFNFGSCRLK
jgi:hypothetical protein